MKPRLRLCLDGNWYPTAGILELSRYDPEPLCAAIRLIRRLRQQATFGRGFKLLVTSHHRWKQRYAATCFRDGQPWHLWGLPWRVTEPGAYFIDPSDPNTHFVPRQPIPSFWTLELL